MTATRRALALRYGRIARAYRDHWAPVLLALADPVLARIPVEPGARALDVGAGVGTIGGSLVARGATVTGLDATEGMLRECDRRLARVCGDATRVPFAAGSFDAAVCTFVLQHVPFAGRVFGETARVLRPGGTLTTATWGASAAETGGPYDVMQRALDEAGAATDELGGMRTWHARVDAPAKVRRYARAAGFTHVEAWSEVRAYSWTVDSFLGWARSSGPFGRRLAATDPERRDRALAIAARGLGSLSEEDLVWTPEVVFLVAER